MTTDKKVLLCKSYQLPTVQKFHYIIKSHRRVRKFQYQGASKRNRHLSSVYNLLYMRTYDCLTCCTILFSPTTRNTPFQPAPPLHKGGKSWGTPCHVLQLRSAHLGNHCRIMGTLDPVRSCLPSGSPDFNILSIVPIKRTSVLTLSFQLPCALRSSILLYLFKGVNMVYTLIT